MHDDDTLLGLEHAGRVRPHRGGRPVFSSRGAIYHLNARTGSRSKGQSARAAAAYIQREAEYGRDQADELVYAASGHMPAWAEADPTDYWDAADLYERANGRLFKRLEVALPTALTAAEQQELAVGFAHHLTAAEHLPYTLAIHAGEGTNPHCHLLISERTNDGLERSPELWFRRYNAAEPEQGGARKTEALKPKAWLEATREAWAEHANQALERAGLEVRIDHRSLEAQGIERLPSLHLGPTVQAMEARGIETERGAEARWREQVNAQLADLGTQREEVAYERTSQRQQLERSGAGVDRAAAALGEPAGGLAAGRERAAGRGLEDGPGRGRGAAAARGAGLGAGAGSVVPGDAGPAPAPHEAGRAPDPADRALRSRDRAVGADVEPGSVAASGGERDRDPRREPASAGALLVAGATGRGPGATLDPSPTVGGDDGSGADRDPTTSLAGDEDRVATPADLAAARDQLTTAEEEIERARQQLAAAEAAHEAALEREREQDREQKRQAREAERQRERERDEDFEWER